VISLSVMAVVVVQFANQDLPMAQENKIAIKIKIE